jgi:protein SCO1/2
MNPTLRTSRGWRVLFIVATAAAIATASEVIMRRARASSGDLPPIAHVPSFTMTDQRGRAVSDESLRGQTLVVDFFYASCTSSCPMLTGKMLGIQRKLAQRERDTGHPLPIHLVSITLDPANDTPDVLRAYAERTGADERRWSFLSGRSEDLDRVVVRGFKSTFERADPSAGIGTIMHGEWFVLVDGAGTLRGFYAASDAERMDSIVDDAEHLAGGSS